MKVPFLEGVSPWLSIPLVFLVWALVMSLVKKAAFAIAKKFAAKTETQVDDILFEALDFPVQLVIYASGVLVIQGLFPQGGTDVLKHLLTGFKVVCIVSVILFIEKFLGGLITLYSEKIDVLKASSGFAHGLVRIIIFGLGALVILDSIGVSITPIIASLGIGSLAVALALQPTLENFFSGLQLIADKPIQIGQFIRLESGEEGIVQKIGWRSTWIALPNNNTVIMPNKLVVNSRVTNFCYPTPELAVPVAVGVAYGSDLDKVERVTLGVAREVLKTVPGSVAGFEPVLRYHTLADSSINFNVVLRSRDIASSHLIRHEFIKRLQKAYDQEGIKIPYPTRTIINEA